jgi:hypothetical protein
MRPRLGIAAGLAVLVAGAVALVARPGQDAEPARAPSSAPGSWRMWGIAPDAPGFTRVLAPLADDAAILVSAPDEIYNGPGDLTVDLVRPGQPHRRWIERRKLLVDVATTEGETDLLARGPYDRLSLLRVGPDGAVRHVWQSANADGPAAVARVGSKIAIAWVSGVNGVRRQRAVLWLAAAAEPDAPIRTHRVAGVLPSWLRRLDPTWLADLDVAVDANGRVTLALTAWSRPRQQLVLATTDEAGHVLQRQVTNRVEGLVELQSAPDGRTAAMVEDTGIEGEVGECVEDGFPRVIRLAVREPTAHRFGRTRVMDRLAVNCDASDARLVTGPHGGLALLWGVAPHWDRPTRTFVRLALAGPGQPSLRRAGRWRRVRFEAALLDAAGGLFVFGTRLGVRSDPLAGPLHVQRRSATGNAGQTELLDRQGAVGEVFAALRPDGKALVAWTREDGTRRLAIRAVP